MEETACVVCCANLSREVRAVMSGPEFAGCAFKTCSVECDQSEGKWKDLPGLLSGGRTDERQVVVIGGYCLIDEEIRSEQGRPVNLSRKGQCLDWLVDGYIMEILQREGKFLLLPGWVDNWKSYVESRWADDRKRVRAHFAGLGRKAVLLDTGLYPDIQEKMRAFSRFIQIPFETMPTGLSLFKLNLLREVHGLASRLDDEAYKRSIDSLRRRTIKFSNIINLLDYSFRETEEKDFGSLVRDVFNEVLAPLQTAFFPPEVIRQARIVRGSPLDRLFSQGIDYVWDLDSGSLVLRVGDGREPLGIIEVSKVPSDLKDETLAIALSLVKAAGAALLRNKLSRQIEVERERTEKTRAALKESEIRMNSIFEGVPVGLYRTNSEGGIIDANLAFARMTGYNSVEAVKKINCRDLYADPQARVTSLSLVEPQGMVKDFEFQMKRRDGEIIWVKDTSRAVRDPAGKTIFYDGAVEDITRKKQTDAFISRSRTLQTSLTDLSEKMLKHVPIQSISKAVLEHALKLTSSRTAVVLYVDRITGKVMTPAMTAEAEEYFYANKERLADLDPIKSQLCKRAIDGGKPLLVNAPEAYRELTAMPQGHFQVDRLIVAPALADDSLVGLIVVANSDRLYQQNDSDALERLADFYALAISRIRAEEELRELSLVDELTKLYNRRGFMALAQQQIKTANRQKKDMILLYADLDDLKLINDNHGHHEGDLALVETASILRSAFRESDIPARIGGDEFVVLALDTVENQEDVLLERLNGKISESNSRPGCKFPISLSVGVVRYSHENRCSIEELIKSADKLMYERKTDKKNTRTLE